ncbi:hypothetical protein CA850_29785 [Micromonospora echinospora]|uniref:Uncharacterized protein n=1 Tax=Micromonospora echinospora TaxID=1877 RepID=A0A1C5AAR9_MICEC|nr:hypothetical protein [Micromonospora echinospora]OZV74771.1 hypothetical protein CA850_29785 [Micromonospora echinospora]SCF42328.1 hypothetical protein GA0070618_6644 [Micromonospora echinospora]
MKVKIDYDGVRAILKSEGVGALIDGATEAVRAQVASHQSVVRHRMPVDADRYQTDREAGAVTIAHAGGLAVQAKYGALTQAAAAAGLEVTDRGDE